MQTEELLVLVDKVMHYQCEFQTLEVKAAALGCPTRLYDSLSAFSNQDEGGVLLFGLDERDGFAVAGVYDAQDLQHKVAEQCKQMEPEVRPLFTVAELDGRFVVAAEIPSAEADRRPVYYRGAGRQRGSYIRVGEADEPMNDYEIYSYDAYRRRAQDDLRVVEGAQPDHLLDGDLQQFLENVKGGSANLASNASDAEILELMGILREGRPTMAAILVLGKYPQAYFPMLDITAVVVEGTQMGDTGDDGERFLANARINGTIGQMLDGAVEFVRRNMRVKTVIDDNGRRTDKPEFPMKAVREVILNALLHRDYSVHTQGTPVTVCMFSDRMEVISKGSLYGRLSVRQLGRVRAEIRNTTLANLLEIMHISENRYSGIPTIRREMALAGLPEPEFIARGGEFKVILRNNIHREPVPSDVIRQPYSSSGQNRHAVTDSHASACHADANSLISRAQEGNIVAGAPQYDGYGQSTYDISCVRLEENTERDRLQRLLAYCRIPRSREEITGYMGFSRYYCMDRMVKPLLQSGALVMTMPDKPKSSKQRYVCSS